jgi:hypothetical protein
MSYDNNSKDALYDLFFIGANPSEGRDYQFSEIE